MQGRVGRARNWVALGLYLDERGALAHFRRVGLFRASRHSFRGAHLTRLVDGILARQSVLVLPPESVRYLESVKSLLTLCGAISKTYAWIVRELRKRERWALKTLVATVDLMFLNPRPGDRELSSDVADYYTIEEHAEALSFLVHTFASFRRISERDFRTIDEKGIAAGIYSRLLVAACKLRVYQEAELWVDVFGYSAQYEQRVVHLRPSEPRLEQSIRMGYVHTAFQKHSMTARMSQEDDDGAVSLREVAKDVYSVAGREMVRRREGVYSRYALFLPEAQQLLEPFRMDRVFKEDMVYLDAVAKEQFCRPDTLMGFQLADQLTMFDVVKIQRFLRFMGELLSQRLVPLLDDDRGIVMQSLLPVFRRAELLRVLRHCVSESAAETFLRVAAFDHGTRSGVFDVQYEPLIFGGDYCLLPMNILCSSDMLRNLLYTQRRKVEEAGSDAPMQNMVANALRQRSSRVEENVKVRGKDGPLEADIMAIVGQHLLLVECKSAFHPCGVHELRTSYEHLLKARRQLDRLRAALESEGARDRLFRRLKWGAVNVERVLTCVVSGNRVFNGYVVGDHPVRPAYELMNMVSEGRIGVGEESVRVWRGEDFEPQDLVDYLEGTTIHADFFDALEESALQYDFGGASLVQWTYVFDAVSYVDVVTERYGTAPPSS